MAHIVNISPRESQYITEIKRGDGHIPDMLFDLLTCASPHGWEGHIRDILNAGYLAELLEKDIAKVDSIGNLIVPVGKPPYNTMFSCHMDTVHFPEKSAKPENKLTIELVTMNKDAPEQDRGIMWGAIKKKDGKYDGVQLGADDKVGCYIMWEMIDCEIPGLYIFHVGEELGGKGSDWLVKNTPELVKGVKRAIAFDRAGTEDIICNQRGGRCCSKKFADALADKLNANMPPSNRYKSEIHGTFTDTANYIKLIPECTNISVGYYNQHGSSEKLDFYFLKTFLLPAILKINWDELPTERDPLANTSHYSRTFNDEDYSYGYGYARQDGRWVNGVFIKDEQLPSISHKLLSRETPKHRCPPWKPSDGVPSAEISYPGMCRLVENWITSERNYEIANVIASIIIERDALRITNVDKSSRLILLDKFLGEGKDGKKLIDEIIETEKNKARKVKEAEEKDETENNQYSDKSTDAEGFPLTKDERVKRTREKMVLMGVYVSQRTSIKLPTKEQADFGHLVQRYNKLNGHVKQSNDTISDKLYASVNTVLWRMTDIMDHADNCTAISDSALATAIEYIKANRDEPGFPKNNIYRV